MSIHQVPVFNMTPVEIALPTPLKMDMEITEVKAIKQLTAMAFLFRLSLANRQTLLAFKKQMQALLAPF
jgi:hypothetical protein